MRRPGLVRIGPPWNRAKRLLLPLHLLLLQPNRSLGREHRFRVERTTASQWNRSGELLGQVGGLVEGHGHRRA